MLLGHERASEATVRPTPRRLQNTWSAGTRRRSPTCGSTATPPVARGVPAGFRIDTTGPWSRCAGVEPYARRACPSPKWAVTKCDLARHLGTSPDRHATVMLLN
jgi:hypothetical protein